MCIIEFVDFNEAYTLGIAPTAAAEAKPKTRRSRKKSTTDAVEDATVVEGETKKKAAAPKAPKAPKATAAKAVAPKVAKKTNVGKKM